MQTVVADAAAIAPHDSSVLIEGESGVGKELIARCIHHHSPRARRPMATISCAGVAETLLESELFGHVPGSADEPVENRGGIFETASGSTLFLDEVSEMTPRTQAKLLRELDTSDNDGVGAAGSRGGVRIVSATKRGLLYSGDPRFREDLYYRLNVVRLVVPPLRARPEDVVPLLDYYREGMSERFALPPCEFTADALEYLKTYEWPGNLRELRNLTDRAALQYAGASISLKALTRLLGNRALARQQAPAPRASAASTQAEAVVCFEQMTNAGQSFWTAVYDPFMQHDLTRDTVRAIVRAGLDETKGSYRRLAVLFRVPESDYRRFLSFLQKHDCHLPFTFRDTAAWRMRTG